ncbi:MAG: OmpA family protein [Deltaproteobacteria bacterium]|nr:OmpA family protein [Deltaproteobacteria bacterium]
MSGAPHLFLVSSRTADTVVNIFKNELKKRHISVGRDTPDMLRFFATVPEWTTVLESIQTDLEKEGIQLTEKTPRILQLAITDVSLIWEPRVIGCRLNLRVVTGDGETLDFHGTNFAIDLHDSCDGAVTKEVAAMFNNNRIRTYLTAPTQPKDADCDGVPDYLDTCPGTPLGVDVDRRGCPIDTDGDGVPDYLDKCPGTPKGMAVDSHGCPLDTDGDGVPDYQDACPGTPKGARVDQEGCWVIHEAFFDFDKYEIRPRFYPIFDEVVAVLQNNPSLKIMIEGYTDNIGTEKYNQKLSEERARAVKDYLIKKGIQKDRLSTVGYASSRPKASNKTTAGRALNRRVKLEPLTNRAK